MDVFDKCNAVTDSKTLVEFLNLLAEDFRKNQNNEQEWCNGTVDEFLEAIAGWINDNADPPSKDPINWDPQKAAEVAKIFYIGKIYE